VIWDDLTLLVRRGIVDAVVSDVKTEYSRTGMPLDSALAEVLLQWRRRTEFAKPEDWIFASPFKAARCRGSLGECSCGIGHIGWHTFRHTFRSLLDETGAPLKVQQELMRQADIRTTMNIYGKTADKSKREAHGKIVRLVLGSQVA